MLEAIKDWRAETGDLGLAIRDGLYGRFAAGSFLAHLLERLRTLDGQLLGLLTGSVELKAGSEEQGAGRKEEGGGFSLSLLRAPCSVRLAPLSPPCVGGTVWQPVGTPWQQLIVQTAEKHGVDPALALAVAKAESHFDPKAVSPKGAMGIMQLMPQTAKSLGVADPFDPAQNIDGGIRYLRQLLERFNGNIVLAIAAYNAGPNAVRRYGGVPPYPETQAFVRKVLTYWHQFRQEQTTPSNPLTRPEKPVFALGTKGSDGVWANAEPSLTACPLTERAELADTEQGRRLGREDRGPVFSRTEQGARGESLKERAFSEPPARETAPVLPSGEFSTTSPVPHLKPPSVLPPYHRDDASLSLTAHSPSPRPSPMASSSGSVVHRMTVEVPVSETGEAVQVSVSLPVKAEGPSVQVTVRVNDEQWATQLNQQLGTLRQQLAELGLVLAQWTVVADGRGGGRRDPAESFGDGRRLPSASQKRLPAPSLDKSDGLWA